MIFVGLAVLRTSTDHPLRKDGFVGAYASFACDSDDIAVAVKQLHAEFTENNLILIGLEAMFERSTLSRDLTLDEVQLVEKTLEYPVQFKNIHLFKADS